MTQNKRMFVFLIVLSLSWMGISQCDSCPCQSDTLSVVGNSEVQLTPDFATVVIRVQVTGTRSSLALSALATKIQQVIAIVVALPIPAADYSTQNLFLSPQYDYSSGTGVVVGQTASQQVRVIVRNIGTTITLETLIDRLIGIVGISINGISFDKTDKSAALDQARQAAWINAHAKATQYATLSSKIITRVLRIQDQGQDQYFSGFYDAQIPVVGGRTIIFIRKITVSASVRAIYYIRALPVPPAVDPVLSCFDLLKNVQRGQGSTSVNPDIAILTLTIEQTRTSAASALAVVNNQVSSVRNVLTARGVALADIITTSFNVLPKYQFLPNGSPPTIVGYTASHTLQVTIRSIGTLGSSLGPLIDAVAAVANGIIVQGIRFDVANKTPVFAAARAAAYANARAKAVVYSAVSGTGLGSVVSISEEEFQPSSFAREKFASPSGAADTVIKAQALQFTASVVVTWRF